MFSDKSVESGTTYPVGPSRSIDHRTQVGAERSRRTRAKLISGAFRAFASQSVNAKMIDLVIREAGVARGTFYNHFRTSEEVLHEAAKAVSIEIIRIVDPLVRQQRDPAARVACGVGSVVRLAIAYPAFAQFVVRGGPAAVTAGSLASEIVPGDIDAGISSGRFSISDRKLALDLILGPVLMAFHKVLTEKVPSSYPNLLAQSVLQSLGVSKSLAHGFAFRDFGEIEITSDSILANASS
jgi:AcrR family transcriptional regulator